MSEAAAVLSVEAVRTRMNVRLANLGLEMKELAGRTGDDYRSVQRWLRETTTPPVDFLARFCVATKTNGDWLLAERGDPELLDPSQAEAQLRAIRAILAEPISESEADHRRRIAEMRAAKDRARAETAAPEQLPYNEGRSNPRRRRGA